ncbi:hypothetical protein Y695_00008 [Hydrogenophaga sp. T4]|nr:hypothetical protein Y695_00008 [Hydrogenophaga sp. T4]
MSEAIEAAWQICIGPLQAKKGAMTHEDHITMHLVKALRRTKKVPGRIEYQHDLLFEDTNGNVSQPSSIDFVLTVGDDEDVYLAYECKRLNVPYAARVRNLCVPYVDEGLMRFVTGQYSNGLPMATMLGYVMNGDNGRARRGLRKVMKARAATLGLTAELDHPSLPGAPTRFRSTHKCRPGQSIDVEHQLLPWP